MNARVSSDSSLCLCVYQHVCDTHGWMHELRGSSDVATVISSVVALTLPPPHVQTLSIRLDCHGDDLIPVTVPTLEV